MRNGAFPEELSRMPVLTREEHRYRVSVIRNGRVESYLCETEAQAKRFAQLLAQAPQATPNARYASPPTRRALTSNALDATLRLIRSATPSWKSKG